MLPADPAFLLIYAYVHQNAVYSYTLFVMPGNMVYDRLLKQQVPAVTCKAIPCALHPNQKTYRTITFTSLSVPCGYTGVHRNEGWQWSIGSKFGKHQYPQFLPWYVKVILLIRSNCMYTLKMCTCTASAFTPQYPWGAGTPLVTCPISHSSGEWYRHFSPQPSSFTPGQVSNHHIPSIGSAPHLPTHSSVTETCFFW